MHDSDFQFGLNTRMKPIHEPFLKNLLWLWSVALFSGLSNVDGYDFDLLPRGSWPGHIRGGVTAVAVSGSLVFAGTVSNGGLHILDFSDPADSRRVESLPLPGRLIDKIVVVEERAYLSTSEGTLIIDLSIPSVPRLEGEYATPFQFNHGLVVNGNYAYTSVQGLDVLDVSDPTAPRKITTLQTVFANDLVGQDDHLYAAVSEGLRVIDISQADRPKEVGGLETVFATRIAVKDDFVYLYDEAEGILVIDVSISSNPKIVREIPLEANALTVVGSYLCVALGERGVSIFDITDPSAPTLVSEIAVTCHVLTGSSGMLFCGEESGVHALDVSDPRNPLFSSSNRAISGAGHGVAVSGQLAYVANGAAGLDIMDLSDPDAPRLLSNVSANGWVVDVILREHLAYVSDTDGGFHVMDVSDPEAPQQLGSYVGEGVVQKAVIQGIHAYLAIGEGRLDVLDISDASDPRRIASLPTGGYASDIASEGDFVYVAAGMAGVLVVDVTNPAVPNLIQEVRYNCSPLFDCPVPATAVAVRSGIIYAGHDFKVVIVDISQPDNPLPLGEFQTDGRVSAITLRDDLAFVAAGFDFQILDVSDPSTPSRLAGYQGFTSRLAVDEHFAYTVGSGGPGFRIFDLTRVAALRKVGRYAETSAVGMAVAEDIGYVIGEFGDVQVIDIADASSPNAVGTYIGADQARAMAIQSRVAYLAVGVAGLELLSLDNPRIPTKIDGIFTGGTAVDVAFEEGYVYVATGGEGLVIIDVGDPQNPRIVGRYRTEQMEMVLAVQGDFAYVVAAGSGMHIVDVRQPSSPRRVALLPIPESEVCLDVAVHGSYAYLACGGGGLLIVNIDTPSDPKIVGTFSSVAPTPGFPEGARQLVVHEGLVYLMEDYIGIHVLDLSDPAHPIRVGGRSAHHEGAGVTVTDENVIIWSKEGLTILDQIRSPIHARIDISRYSKDSGSKLRIEGPPGSIGRIERTTNLIDWEHWKDVIFESDPIIIDAWEAKGLQGQFYRFANP